MYPANMISARTLLTFAFVLQHHIRFSSADDGLFTDELSPMFNSDNIDPLQGTTSISYLLDPTISDSDPNFDSSNLFASNVDFNSGSTIDPTSFNIADCGGSSIGNGVFRKNKNRKTRMRRDTLCGTPGSSSPPVPNLSLPTFPSLDQAGKEKDPLRPATAEERKQADKFNILLLLGEQYIQSGPPKDCDFNNHRICTSGDRSDITVDETGYTYTVINSREVKAFIATECVHPQQLFCCKEFFPTLGQATGCRFQPN